MDDLKELQYRQDFENSRRTWYEIDGQFERLYKKDNLGHYVDIAIENQWSGYLEARRFVEIKNAKENNLVDKIGTEDLEKMVHPV